MDDLEPRHPLMPTLGGSQGASLGDWLQEQFQALGRTQERILQRLDALERGQAELGRRVEAIAARRGGRIDGAGDRLDELADAIDALQTTVDDLSSTLSDVESTVDSIESTVESLERF